MRVVAGGAQVCQRTLSSFLVYNSAYLLPARSRVQCLDDLVKKLGIELPREVEKSLRFQHVNKKLSEINLDAYLHSCTAVYSETRNRRARVRQDDLSSCDEGREQADVRAWAQGGIAEGPDVTRHLHGHALIFNHLVLNHHLLELRTRTLFSCVGCVTLYFCFVRPRMGCNLDPCLPVDVLRSSRFPDSLISLPLPSGTFLSIPSGCEMSCFAASGVGVTRLRCLSLFASLRYLKPSISAPQRRRRRTSSATTAPAIGCPPHSVRIPPCVMDRTYALRVTYTDSIGYSTQAWKWPSCSL